MIIESILMVTDYGVGRNPETMTQIEQVGGLYLIQVKENQPKLLEQCRALAEQSPLAEISHLRENQAIEYKGKKRNLKDYWLMGRIV